MCLVSVALVVAVVGPLGARPAQAALGEGRIGSQGGFSASGKMLSESDQDLAWELDGMASSGARWLRLSFNWPTLQPTPTTWNWSTTDRVVNAAVARGFQVMAMPSYTPAWARPGGTDDKYPPSDLQAYARFVQEAVRRYKSTNVRAWEIWNEPNQSMWWKPRPDPLAYTDMLRRSYAAIKAEDPTALVISAGLAPAPDAPDGSQINGVTFARQMYQAGARGSFDALGMHPSHYPVAPMFPHVDNAFHSTTPALHQLMVDNGDGAKQVWLTEYGAPTGGTRGVSEQDQADWLVQAYDQAVKWPWAGPLFYYMYRDNGYSPTDSDEHFGLLRPDYSWKASRSAFFSEMAKPLPGGSTGTGGDGILLDGQGMAPGSSLASPDGRYVLWMQGDGNLVVRDPSRTAIWTSGTYGRPNAQLQMQGDGNLVIYSASGPAIWSSATNGQSGAQLRMQSDGNLVIYIGGTPIWATNTRGG